MNKWKKLFFFYFLHFLDFFSVFSISTTFFLSVSWTWVCFLHYELYMRLLFQFQFQHYLRLSLFICPYQLSWLLTIFLLKKKSMGENGRFSPILFRYPLFLFFLFVSTFWKKSGSNVEDILFLSFLVIGHSHSSIFFALCCYECAFLFLILVLCFMHCFCCCFSHSDSITHILFHLSIIYYNWVLVFMYHNF